MKTVSSTLSALPVEGKGLIIAAADAKTSTACLVGTVPVASDGSFADAAGRGSGQDGYSMEGGTGRGLMSAVMG
jgi:hypothetical protein